MRLIFVAFLLLFSFQMAAQTCCSGGVPLSNNLGLPNEGKGALLLGINYDFNNLNTLNAGSNKLDDDSRKRTTNSALFSLGYAITDRFSVETLFTWVNQSRTINQFNNENLTETSGIGDAVLLIKYALPNVFGANSQMNLGLGTKAPLGKSDITTDQGIQLTADLQPGSGAWDGLGWISISKGVGFRPSATVSGSFTYRMTGKNNSYLNNSSIYEFGNALQAILGYTDQFLLLNLIVNPGLVFKYRKAGVDEIDNSVIPNTGGDWVFIRPEISIQISPSIALQTRLELPIYSNVDGTQLTPTTRFATGLSFRLNKKSKNIINSTL